MTADSDANTPASPLFYFIQAQEKEHRKMAAKIYRFQVNTFGDPADSWAGNAIVYDTAEKAIAAAKDLFSRWYSVKFWRVVDDSDTVVSTGP